MIFDAVGQSHSWCEKPPATIQVNLPQNRNSKPQNGWSPFAFALNPKKLTETKTTHKKHTNQKNTPTNNTPTKNTPTDWTLPPPQKERKKEKEQISSNRPPDFGRTRKELRAPCSSAGAFAAPRVKAPPPGAGPGSSA